MSYSKVREGVLELGLTQIPGILMVCVRRAIRLGCFKNLESLLRAIRIHAEDELSSIIEEKHED